MALRLKQSFRLFTRALSKNKYKHFNTKVNDTQPNVLQLVVAEKSKELNEKIADFVTTNFTKYEPVTIAAELDCTEDLRRYILRNLEVAKTLLILNPSNKEILSVAVNMDTKPNTFQLAKEYARLKVNSERTKRLIYFWSEMTDSARLFDCFPVEKIWTVAYLATSDKMTGCGLSSLLTRQSRKMAVKSGYSVIHMDCTSFYSANLAKKLGFSAKLERDAQSYKDGSGRPWIGKSPSPPHGKVVVAYEKLERSNSRPKKQDKRKKDLNRALNIILDPHKPKEYGIRREW